MASLYEQYEQQSASGHIPLRGDGLPALTPARLSQNPMAKLIAAAEPHTPIFRKLKIEFNPKESLTNLVVCNEVLVMGMIDKTLLRVNLQNADQPEELSLASNLAGSLSQYRMQQIFLDPLGNHLLVTVLQDGPHQGDNFYMYLGGVNAQKRTFHRVLRGHVITAVAFNPDNEQNGSTGPILLATSKGCIFEAEFAAPAEADWRFTGKSTPDKYCKQIYQLKNETSISGLYLELVSSPAGGSPQAVVFLSTARCLYTFFGPTVPSVDIQPTFANVFILSETYAYNNSRELPNPTTKSVLHVFTPKKCAQATHVACLFGPVGVYHGHLTVSTELGGSLDTGPWLRFAEEPQTLEFDLPRQLELSTLEQPVGMLLSNYHILVLFGDKLRAFSQLDHSLVMEDPFPQGRMLGLARDPIKGVIWAFSHTAVYRYKTDKEDRNMWRALLAKKEYEQAKLFCKDDLVKLNKVCVRQAQDLFRQGQYEASARMYSETCSSFEEVSLRFLEADQEPALRIILKEKLNKLGELVQSGRDPSKRPQVTMLIAWLIQLYLNRLGHLKHQLAKKAGECPPEIPSEFKQLNTELRKMLRSGIAHEVIQANREPFYKLIANHGDEDLLLEFSELMHDYGRVLQQHLQNKRFKEALEVLRNQRNAELYYQFSPELMSRLPEQLVDCWLSEPHLDAVRLIPSLVQLSALEGGGDTFNPRAPHITHSIRYLEVCVKNKKCQEEAIHNYLIALYARLGAEDKLLKYLEEEGNDMSAVRYDAKFALRVFAELGLHKASIHVYVVMGLYSEALELALKQLEDVSLAKSIANRPEEEELRKKLWLVIASHVVRQGEDVGQAMELLTDCGELLRIEDILPFFPEFVCIDHFKDAICKSLQSYKERISHLRETMNSSTEAADQIRAEIVEVRNRCYVVEPEHRCDVCSFALLSQAFVVFPCLHRFHIECLRQAIREIPLPASSAVLDVASDSQLKAPADKGVMTGADRGRNVNLEDVLAQECLFCGELIADSVSAPFFAREEYEKLQKQWL